MRTETAFQRLSRARKDVMHRQVKHKETHQNSGQVAKLRLHSSGVFDIKKYTALTLDERNGFGNGPSI
jgi:hypothetical protein